MNLTSSQTSREITVARVCSEDRVVFKDLGNVTTPLQFKIDRDLKLAQQPLRRVPEAPRRSLKEYLDESEAERLTE